ncbi:MAG: KH domain-containing protein [Candidatus Levybacteria bacterium]|nr:KH domain-containing protein [Candidatus Levybacteria bacterium]MBI2190143.1 KH domain-containing protein [Candidatus Levybacteria bacterium]MBI2622838.1 KH domain-containing protein [Candidatus Levybacteria bacterium]MBI3069720.1 KH domain-containing protein [Candidatus Levybacteria bacterium]MBI3093120.1 KH domain-containing protein [Candidatus Levybacteria bacterium]
MKKTKTTPDVAKSKKREEKDERKIIDKESKILLGHLGISADCEVFLNDEGAQVILETLDSGIVIGYHGENLEALQLILSLAVSKKIGRFVRISVDIGDYKKNRSDFLQNLTLQTKEKVLQENQEFFIPNLKSWERRIVHMFLQNDEEVISESVGEGRERTLVIKPRTKQGE